MDKLKQQVLYAMLLLPLLVVMNVPEAAAETRRSEFGAAVLLAEVPESIIRYAPNLPESVPRDAAFIVNAISVDFSFWTVVGDGPKDKEFVTLFPGRSGNIRCPTCEKEVKIHFHNGTKYIVETLFLGKAYAVYINIETGNLAVGLYPYQYFDDR